jgi:hypothetical protein
MFVRQKLLIELITKRHRLTQIEAKLAERLKTPEASGVVRDWVEVMGKIRDLEIALNLR